MSGRTFTAEANQPECERKRTGYLTAPGFGAGVAGFTVPGVTDLVAPGVVGVVTGGVVRPPVGGARAAGFVAAGAELMPGEFLSYKPTISCVTSMVFEANKTGVFWLLTSRIMA